jgi:tetratricopeptide (TPR) repeat protein
MTSSYLAALAAAGLTVMAGTAPPARAEGFVTILGTSPFAACAAAALEAKRTGIGTRFGLELCNRAIQTWTPPSADLAHALVNRSVIHILLADPGAAIADTDQAIRLDPALAEAYLDRGIALSAENRPAQAEDDFTQALSLKPAHPELAYFDRAAVREDVGDIKGAYLDYGQAATLSPGWEQPRKELARFTVVTSGRQDRL